MGNWLRQMAAQTTWNRFPHHVEFANFFFQQLLNPVEDRLFRWHDAVEIVHVHDSSDLGVECPRVQLRRFVQFCKIGRKSIFNAKFLQQTCNSIPRRLSQKLTVCRGELLGWARSFWMSDRHLLRYYIFQGKKKNALYDETTHDVW